MAEHGISTAAVVAKHGQLLEPGKSGNMVGSRGSCSKWQLVFPQFGL